MITPRTLLALSLRVALAACGGGKSSNTTSTSSQAAPMATTEAERENAMLPTGAIAAIPASVNCGAVKPVWVNLHSKAYHEAGDPYYGRTKHGQYMCPAQAMAQGYHAAGTHNGAMMNANAGTMSGSKRHHHHHMGSSMSSGSESPAPVST